MAPRETAIRSALFRRFAVVLVLASACGAATAGDPLDQCNAANCAGCCLNNACQVGTTNFACGLAGNECLSCTGEAVCLPSQRCGVDPSQRWIFSVTAASPRMASPRPPHPIAATFSLL